MVSSRDNLTNEQKYVERDQQRASLFTGQDCLTVQSTSHRQLFVDNLGCPGKQEIRRSKNLVLPLGHDIPIPCID
jgi:hypothetical protein